MRDITLVCSVHRENGLCSVGELLRLLLATGPEIVFEEIRPSDVSSRRLRGINSSLEAQALARYHEFKTFQRVAVDRYDMPVALVPEFKRELDSVFEYIERTSLEFRRLSKENDKNTSQHGFNYLSSLAFVSLNTRLSEIELDTIRATGDRTLNRVLDRWRAINLAREREMVRVIYEYCRQHVFDTGVFIVGAAHQIGIVEEIKRYAEREPDLIHWKLSPLDPPSD